jgi:hypothetical protein
VPAGVIFAGPSLRPPRLEYPEVEYRPPAQRGDILRAAEEGISVIGLIDGVFGQSLAVTPTEIRKAARAGMRIYGGASMGALRACECPQSMQGIGAIWSAFKSGELCDDDEVAVTFLPTSFELIAYPLVQVREAGRLATEHYPGAKGLLLDFVERVRDRPYYERTLELMHELASPLKAAGVQWPRMEDWLSNSKFDVKHRDALAVAAAVGAAIYV